MKIAFLATAAVAATLAAAPALAQETTGSAGLTYTNIDTDIDAYKGIDNETVKLDGIVATPIFGNWTVTAQAATVYEDGDWADEELFLKGSVALTKVIGSYRVGGFYAGEEFYNSTINSFGAVAQKYFDKATVSGVASYSTVHQLHAIALKADAAYYATPALRVNLGAEYQTVDGRWTSEMEYLSANIGAEYQIGTSPYSVYGAYNYTDSDDIDMKVKQLSIGVRYNFGGTLQSRDRAGARIDTNAKMNMLPYT